jgi:UDP-N-acetylglucosamine 4,6-dehydratase/5-epimerase
MERVAITGATGYIAEALIKDLISKGIKVNAIARNEGKLVDLKNKFGEIDIYPCPIEDMYLLKKATQHCDGIFHLAALKDVVIAAENPLKTVQTNIIGTLNILNISVENKNIKFVITTSTDKVTKVSGIYSASKLIAEGLFEDFEKINDANCKYRIVRFGNVFYSTGSVLAKWKDAIENQRDLIITDPEATRFFWTREDAVKLLFDCLENSKSSEPLIPKMRATRMGVLLELMIEKYGQGNLYNIKTIGMQKGENLHEYHADDNSSLDAPKWSRDELYAIL